MLKLPPISATPIPEQCLYFYPREKPYIITTQGEIVHGKSSMVTGQGTASIKLFLPQDYVMFKVLFQPGGFYRLFGTPMTLFTGTTEEGTAVLGNEFKVVQQQIEEAIDFSTMIASVERYLLDKVNLVKIGNQPIDQILQQGQWLAQSLDQMAKAACLSPRQFERNFLLRIGVSPKFYERLIRFNMAMKIKQKEPGLSWMHVAYQSGYYDHMHLLRDFKQFTASVPCNFEMETALIY
jgi:AraC-like DNA-binding protein